MATATASEVKKSNETGDTSAPMGSRKASTKEQLSNNKNQLAVLGQKLVNKTATPQDYLDMTALAQTTQKLQAEQDKFTETFRTSVSDNGLEPEDIFAVEAIVEAVKRVKPELFAAPVARAQSSAKAPTADGETVVSGKRKNKPKDPNAVVLFKAKSPNAKFEATVIKGKALPKTIGKSFLELRGANEAETRKNLMAKIVPEQMEYIKSEAGKAEFQAIINWVMTAAPTPEAPKKAAAA